MAVRPKTHSGAVAPAEPVPVAMLGRTSTLELQDPFGSITRQITSAREWLPEGFYIAGYYWDIESGGLALEERGHGSNYQPFVAKGLPRDGGLADLLSEARSANPRFAAVVCEDIERSGRDTFNALTRERELAGSDILLFATDEPIDLDGTDPATILLRRTKQNIAEDFRLQLKRSMWRGMRAHAEQGYNLGKVLDGYLPDKVPHPARPTRNTPGTRCSAATAKASPSRRTNGTGPTSPPIRPSWTATPGRPPSGSGPSTAAHATGRCTTRPTGAPTRSGPASGATSAPGACAASPKPTRTARPPPNTSTTCASSTPTSHIPHPTSHIPHPTSHIPHPTPHTPHPTPHTPHPTPHTPHPTPHTPRHVAAAPGHPRTVQVREDFLKAETFSGLSAYALGPGRGKRLAQLIPHTATARQQQHDRQATTLRARLKRITTQQDNLMQELNGSFDMPDEVGEQYRRIRTDYTHLHDERKSIETQLSELDADDTPAPAPDLVSLLPEVTADLAALLARASNDPGHITKAWPPGNPATQTAATPTRAHTTPAPVQGSIHIPICGELSPNRYGTPRGA